MLHEQLDIRRFKAMFPLDELRKEARAFVLGRQEAKPSAYANEEAVRSHIRLMMPKGEIITSPYHIAVVEQLREEALEGAEPPERMATDVFVFGKGIPANPRVTKIGGIPFWPRKLKWPTDATGKPLEFVAQFNFSDSAGTVGALPGDLLVIFSEEGERSAETLSCHWVNTGDCQVEEICEPPSTNESLVPVYGVLHHTWDYVRDVAQFSQYRSSDALRLIKGTKIGGIPSWIQGRKKLPGDFLCVLGSILPVGKRKYGFINIEEPLGFREVHQNGLLMWGDVGSVYFFLGKDGKVWCAEQGH